MFYHQRNADPEVIAPTFTILGNEVPFFCKGTMVADCSCSAALTAYERPYFGPRAVVEAEVQQGAGHDLNWSEPRRLATPK